MSFFAGGITRGSMDANLLYTYLFFLGRRVELWLLFLAAVTAGVSIHLRPRDGRDRRRGDPRELLITTDDRARSTPGSYFPAVHALIAVSRLSRTSDRRSAANSFFPSESRT